MEMEDVSGGGGGGGGTMNVDPVITVTPIVGSDNLHMFRDIHFWEIPVSDQDRIEIVKR